MSVRARSSPARRLLAGRSVWGVPEPGVLLLTGGDGPARVRARDRARHRRLRPSRRLPGLDASGRDDRGRRAGPVEGPGRPARPSRTARRRGAVPASGGGAAQGRWCGGRRRSPRRRAVATGCGRVRGWRGIPGGSSTMRATAVRCASIVWGHVIVRADGDDRVRARRSPRRAPDWAPRGAERTFEVDAVCTAYGFTPSVELARALGLRAARGRRRARRRHGDVGCRRLRGGRGVGDRRLRARARRGRARRPRRRRPRAGRRGSHRAAGLAALRARRAKLAGFAASSATSSIRVPAWSRLRRPTRSSAAARTSPRVRSTPPWPAARPRCRR